MLRCALTLFVGHRTVSGLGGPRLSDGARLCEHLAAAAVTMTAITRSRTLVRGDSMVRDLPLAAPTCRTSAAWEGAREGAISSCGGRRAGRRRARRVRASVAAARVAGRGWGCGIRRPGV